MDEIGSKGKSQQRISERISRVVEKFFYTLGFSISLKPKKWIFMSLVPVFICLAGFFRFRQEKNPLKLWIPPDSDYVRDTEWLMKNSEEGLRVETIILVGKNVLEPGTLLKLNNITKFISAEQKTEKYKKSWTDLCFKVPIITHFYDKTRGARDTGRFDDNFFDRDPGNVLNESEFDSPERPSIYCEMLNSFPRGCLLYSILDLWQFNSDVIAQLTEKEIIDKINTVTISPTLGHFLNYTELLGGITRDDKGRIISAKAVKTRWMVIVNFTNVNMENTGNDAGTADWATEDVLEWELLFLHKAKQCHEDLEKNKSKELLLVYEASRSFGDISSSTIFQDLDKIALGVVLLFVYVVLVLSKFNWVELRFQLAAFAMLCIGCAFIIAVGICSLLGIPYGPVHSSLPFLVMALGVDDTFIMLGSWKQIMSVEKNRAKPLEEKVGLMLSHAGSAICITSLTDVVAFVIGASTILPTLQSFCIYAAVAVLVTFLLQISLFVAVFSLDVKRIENKENCMFPCIVHELETRCDKDDNKASWKFTDRLYSKVVLTVPGKIVILLATVVLAGFGGYGSYHLEQWFDMTWFLPEDSYLSKYMKAQGREFPGHGEDASVFFSDIDYSREFPRILKLTQNLGEMASVESVNSWPREYIDFVMLNYGKNITEHTLGKGEFHNYLSKFLFSPSGGKYQRNFRFEGKLICGRKAPKIRFGTVDFAFSKFHGPHEWIPAMDATKKLAADAGIDGFVTVWTQMFGSWVTDKVIAREVIRNLVLALICVMAMTSLLIADFQTCFWILLCVLLTLLDVCGFIYFWGYTIDIVSCIGLELAVGLSVDYAAHVAHAFLNAQSRIGKKYDRRNRILVAVKHTGSAVVYGAGSTLLALSLMMLSEAYVFRFFFKIFLLVIVFGLWHGTFFLPVVLSTIGPRSVHVETELRSRELKLLKASSSNEQESYLENKN